MVIFTFVVGVISIRGRFRAVKSGDLSLKYFRTNSGEVPPEYMVKADRHFSNLFEAPTLFYAGCLAAMVTQTVSIAVILFAWSYVAARFLHGFIHLGSNKVVYRMRSYLASWIVLLCLWATVVWAITF